MLATTLIVIAAYLWGAVPSAYLAGRYLKGIDIRRYGSGNLGAANVMDHVGRWTGFGLGVFDTVGKGTLPVIAAGLMGQSLAVQALAGLAAIAGHNWSPYVSFTGGRGVATSIGVLLGLSMWWEMLTGALMIGIVGRLLTRETAVWTLISALALPLLAYLYGEPHELVYMSAGIAALLAVKRLTANWELPQDEYSLLRVLGSRLLWDRDAPHRAQWTSRRPPSDEEG
jgi:glycerol-3-phosphate acyltransferase PlsY